MCGYVIPTYKRDNSALPTSSGNYFKTEILVTKSTVSKMYQLYRLDNIAFSSYVCSQLTAQHISSILSKYLCSRSFEHSRIPCQRAMFEANVVLIQLYPSPRIHSRAVLKLFFASTHSSKRGKYRSHALSDLPSRRWRS